MEVSGSGDSTPSETQHGSDDVANALQCEQCHDNGRFEVASAFCSNCTDYLCSDCVRQHRMIRRLKDHTILEGGTMPKEKPRDDGGDECPEHRGKFIELYCQSDRSLACVLCIAESHRPCTEVTSISKLSTGLEISRELRDLKLSSKKQKMQFSSCRKVIDEYRVLNDGCYDKSVGEFEAFKSKIEASLELLGKRVYKEAGEVKETNEKKLESLSESLNSLEQNLESLMSDIETKETMRKMDQLFVATKKTTNEIVGNRQKLYEMKKDLHIQAYRFLSDPTIQQILDDMVGAGPIKILPGDVTCSADINMKAPDDEKDCGISSLVDISSTDIVAVDCKNECLKQIDVDKEVIVTRRTLRSTPFTATMIPGSRVAVTLPNIHEIQYFDTRNQLAPCDSIQVDGVCFAIQSTDNTLIVSFANPCKVEVMDFEGHVKRSFTTDAREGTLLSLSLDYTDIYGSSDKKEVTCLSTDGRVNWKYKGKHVVPEEREERDDEGKEKGEKKNEDGKGQYNEDEEEPGSEDEHENEEEGFSPAGLATGTDGCLYICSPETHTVHVVSPAGIRLRVIPLTPYKIQTPLAVCFSEMHDCLFVSSVSEKPDDCNFIRRLSFQ